MVCGRHDRQLSWLQEPGHSSHVCCHVGLRSGMIAFCAFGGPAEVLARLACSSVALVCLRLIGTSAWPSNAHSASKP